MFLKVYKDDITKFCLRVLLFEFIGSYESDYRLDFDELDDSDENMFLFYRNGTSDKVIVGFYYYRQKDFDKFKNVHHLNNLNINCEVFYEKNVKSKNENYSTKVFDKKFINQFNNKYNNIETMIIEKFLFFNDVNDTKQRIFKCFNNLITKFDSSKEYFKYKAIDDNSSDEKNSLVNNFIGGMMTYSHPDTFNDPFDCDFTIIDDYGNNLVELNNFKDKMRVLCLTDDYKDICMWGYYGGNHKGFCVGHKLNDILNSTYNYLNGFVIYGDVLYSNKRPKHIYEASSLLESRVFYFLHALCKCCFIKYKKWEHENEFRIVTFLDFFKDDNNMSPDKKYVNIDVKPTKVVIGCQHEYNPIFELPSSCVSLSKDNSKYKLNE